MVAMVDLQSMKSLNMHSLLFHLLSAGDVHDAEGILNLDAAEILIEFARVRLRKIHAHSVFVN